MSYEAPQYEDLSEENIADNNEEYLITLTTKKTTPEMTSTTTTTTTASTTTAITKTAHTKESSSEKDIDLCNDPEIDDITRTEWGNAFIFKGSKFNFRLVHKSTSCLNRVFILYRELCMACERSNEMASFRLRRLASQNIYTFPSFARKYRCGLFVRRSLSFY